MRLPAGLGGDSEDMQANGETSPSVDNEEKVEPEAEKIAKSSRTCKN